VQISIHQFLIWTNDCVKNIFLVLIVLLSSHNLFAQFSWGVRTGVQYSTISFNKDRYGSTPRLAYLTPGLYFEQQLNSSTMLSADIQYTNKGLLRGSLTQDRYTLQYLSVPILFHYKPTNDFSFFVGPEFGLRLGGSFVIDGERISDSDLFTKHYDIGASGGITLQISPEYKLMFRYTHGLVNILDENYQVFDNVSGIYKNARDIGYKFTNRSFQLSFSSAFVIPKSEGKKSVSFGLRQGVSFSTVYGSGVDDISGHKGSISNTRIGYESGIDVRVAIQKYFFFSTGVSYLQRGGQIENDQVLKINYVSLPLIFGISPILTNDFALSIEGGLGINKQLKFQNPYTDSVVQKLIPTPVHLSMALNWPLRFPINLHCF